MRLEPAVRLVVSVTVATALAGCMRDDEPQRPGRAAIDALVAFARNPTEETWRAVRFAPSVGLGLGDSIRARRSARALRDPAAWKLSVELFRARAGTASALELIATEDGPLQVTHGPHRHCAAAPVPPPTDAAGLSRVSVQPREPVGCLDWWTVDAFVDEDGTIRVVTLDLWEP